MMRHLRLAIVIAAVIVASSGFAALSFSSQATAQASFSVTDIGLPEGFDSITAVDINDQGWILVNASSESEERAFLYRDGEFIALGSEDESSYGAALNETGLTAGWSIAHNDGTGPDQPRGVLLTDEMTVELVTNGFDSRALGLDEEGLPVGEARLTEESAGRQPVFWTADGMGVLPGIAGETAGAVHDINILRQMVGWSGEAPDSQMGHATLWEDGEPADLGTLGGDWSDALAINDQGLIVGISATSLDQAGPMDDGVAAFSWDDGQMLPLPTADGQDWSVAYDVNSVGMIVGAVRTDGSEQTVASLWSGQSIDLLDELIDPDAGLDLVEAVAINEFGQILCQAVDESGSTRVALLTVLGN
jgi:probable HAF family extracellular repeat protein